MQTNLSADLIRAYKDARNSLGERERIPPQWHSSINGDKWGAKSALDLARLRLSIGRKFYSDKWPWQRGAGNVSRQRKTRPGDNYAWIEDAKTAGLRFVGYCDEIERSIRHKGWYTDEFQDSALRGAVWQLPARRGVARYIAGYCDPNIDGAAFVDLDIISETSAPRRRWNSAKRAYDLLAPVPQEECNDSAMCAASRMADEIARVEAEKEREFNEIAIARFRFDEIPETISALRSQIRQMIGELRQARKTLNGARLPLSCKTLRDAIRSGLREIQDLREEREKLESDYSYSEHWEAC